MKITKFFSKNFTDLKESIKSYPATYVLTLLATFIVVITWDNGFILDKVSFEPCNKTIVFYIGSVLVVWMAEILFNNWIYRAVGYIAGILSGFLFTYMIVPGAGISFEEENFRYIIGFNIALVLMCIYVVFRKKKVNSYKYIQDVFQSIVNYCILYGVLNVGLSIVLAIFIMLVLDGEYATLWFRLQMLLVGLVGVPLCILAVTKKRAHLTTFVINLIKFVLYPITLIAMLVIYIFIGKCLVLQELKIVYIFKCVAVIFALGFPSIIIMHNHVKNKFIKVSTLVATIAFIPFVALQIYTLSVMCKNYGLTYSRYFGIPVLIIEIGVIAFTLFMRKKDMLEVMLIVIAVIAIFTCITPILNYEDAVVSSQLNRIKKAWPKGKEYKQLTKKEKKRFASAYEYIVYSMDAEKKLPDYIRGIDDEHIESVLNEVSAYIEEDEDGNYVSFSIPYHGTSIDVKDYEEISVIDSIYQEANDNEKEYKEYQTLVKHIIEKYGSSAVKELEKDNIRKLNDNTDIYITYLEVSYEEKEDKVEIESYGVEGVKLIKKADTSKEDNKKNKDKK